MNLLEETITILKCNNLSEKDVKWVGTWDVKTTWENFKNIANVDYDAGHGGQEVAIDLLIVGDNWWLERGEYDGAEWWEFKKMPVKPISNIIIKALTREQAEILKNDTCGGWDTLDALNGIKK